MKERTDRPDFIQTRLKTSQKMRKQTIDWEITLAKNASDKGPLSTTCTGLLKFSNKKMRKKPNLNQHLTRRAGGHRGSAK